jgi:hypothetical protein
MSRLLLVSGAVVALCLAAPPGSTAQEKHPHLHHAIYEMREAERELREAKHDFGGHRAKALKALEAAVHQTEKALEAVGAPYKTFKPGKIYGSYKNHPHLRHALVEMREAERELREAKHDFKGHRERALKDLEHAVAQTKLCIDNIK